MLNPLLSVSTALTVPSNSTSNSELLDVMSTPNCANKENLEDGVT